MNKNQVETLRLKDYVLGPQIGKGTFGTVFQCTNLRSGITAAVKITDVKTLRMRSAVSEAKILREVRIMRELSHPNIVAFIDAFLVKDVLYLVTELVLGVDLFETILSRDGLDEPAAKFLFAQIVSALSYLHSRGVMHRDVKPENILLASNARLPPRRKRRLRGMVGHDELAERENVVLGGGGGGGGRGLVMNAREGFMGREEEEETDDDDEQDGLGDLDTGSIPDTTRVKLIDFGLSKLNDEQDMSVVGTPRYIAPEIVRLAQMRNHLPQRVPQPSEVGDGGSASPSPVVAVSATSNGTAYDFSADCYSAGIVLFVMLSARFPSFEMDPEDPRNRTTDAASVSKLDVVLEDRPTRILFDAAGDANVTRISPLARDLIHKLTTHDPRRRISMREAAFHPFLFEASRRYADLTTTHSSLALSSSNETGAIVPFLAKDTSGAGGVMKRRPPPHHTSSSSSSSSSSSFGDVARRPPGGGVAGRRHELRHRRHHHHHPHSHHHHHHHPHGMKRKIEFDREDGDGMRDDQSPSSSCASTSSLDEEMEENDDDDFDDAAVAAVRELGPVTIVPSFASSALVQSGAAAAFQAALNNAAAGTSSSSSASSPSSSSSSSAVNGAFHAVNVVPHIATSFGGGFGGASETQLATNAASASSSSSSSSTSAAAAQAGGGSATSSSTAAAAAAAAYQTMTIADVLRVPGYFEALFLRAMSTGSATGTATFTPGESAARAELASIWNAAKDLFANCDRTLIHIGNTAALVLRSLSDVRLAVEEGEVEMLHVTLKMISEWISVLYGEIDAVLRSNRMIDDVLTRFSSFSPYVGGESDRARGVVASDAANSHVSVERKDSNNVVVESFGASPSPPASSLASGDPAVVVAGAHGNNINGLANVTESIAHLSLVPPLHHATTTTTYDGGLANAALIFETDFRYRQALAQYGRRMIRLLQRHLAFWIKLEAFMTYIAEQTKYVDGIANHMRNPNRLRERFLQRMEEFLSLWRQIVALSEQFRLQLYQKELGENPPLSPNGGSTTTTAATATATATTGTATTTSSAMTGRMEDVLREATTSPLSPSRVSLPRSQRASSTSPSFAAVETETTRMSMVEE